MIFVNEAALARGTRILSSPIEHNYLLRAQVLVRGALSLTSISIPHLSLLVLFVCEWMNQGDFVHKWDLLKDCTVIYLNNENRWFKAVSCLSCATERLMLLPSCSCNEASTPMIL